MHRVPGSLGRFLVADGAVVSLLVGAKHRTLPWQRQAGDSVSSHITQTLGMVPAVPWWGKKAFFGWQPCKRQSSALLLLLAQRGGSARGLMRGHNLQRENEMTARSWGKELLAPSLQALWLLKMHL